MCLERHPSPSAPFIWEGRSSKASGHECGTRISSQKATESTSVSVSRKIFQAQVKRAGAEKYLTDERGENRKLGSSDESGVTVQRKYADADH